MSLTFIYFESIVLVLHVVRLIRTQVNYKALQPHPQLDNQFFSAAITSCLPYFTTTTKKSSSAAVVLLSSILILKFAALRKEINCHYPAVFTTISSEKSSQPPNISGWQDLAYNDHLHIFINDDITLNLRKNNFYYL